MPRRWHFWTCFEGSENDRVASAKEEIAFLESIGFKAKIWAPLPQHKWSGHLHIVVLCTREELMTIIKLSIEEIVFAFS